MGPFPPFGDFKCWDTLGTAIGVVSSLTLTDQFGELAGDFDLTPREYCTAATKTLQSGERFQSPYWYCCFLCFFTATWPWPEIIEPIKEFTIADSQY